MNEKAQTLLKEKFGYSSFRAGQEEIIDALLTGRDAVGIMPTGAGKSLCFQIPALLMDGITLVISPLISLMKDQVGALIQSEIPAAYINSSLSLTQIQRVLENAVQGMYKIIYIAPERLEMESFVDFAMGICLPFVAVDEAHCVSQWGQDFRPGYLKISEFLAKLPHRPIVGAFTATATSQVREDLIALLELRDPQLVATGFDRKNLHFSVKHPLDKQTALFSFLKERKEKSGIVYCLTRKTVESVCENLQKLGYSAARYHAGLSNRERIENQEAFQRDEVRVMVATNAFGMGIDKSNVSFVVHYNMPKNMESYYQEAGRAGRDGSPAECILFYAGKDVSTNQFLIEQVRENAQMTSQTFLEFRQTERDRLKKMTFYCHTTDCLRGYILRYFGERTAGYCANCGSCLSECEESDITVSAQKILSSVKRMKQRFGIKLVVDTLRGSKNQRVISLGLNELSTYGIMSDTSEKRLRDIIGFLVLEDYLVQSDDEFPVLRLGSNANRVLFEEYVLRMRVPKDRIAIAARERRSTRKTDDFEIENPRLLSKLQALRTKLANAQSVPAFVIFSDASLRDMCQQLPETLDAFLEVSGVGEAKRTRYGKAFLEVIRAEKERSDGVM